MPPAGLLPSEQSNGEPLPEPVKGLSASVRRALDLVQLGTSITEAARQAGISPSTVHNARASKLGTEYMALQEQALSTWMKGLLYQATAVFERELAGTNPLRAADMIFKHLGGLLALGGNAADARTADATALARELFKAAGINININTKGDSEPEVKVIERDQS